MSALLQTLNLEYRKAKLPKGTDDIKTKADQRTQEFIDAVECALKDIVRNVNGTLPKHTMMNIPKECSVEGLINWLNDNKLPFEIINQYNSGRLYIQTLKFESKQLIACVGNVNQ
jgi:hypothetical protein